MENNHQRSRNHFVRNGEGTSSVRLRRRKDQVSNPNGEYSKKRNRHSGDFYQWNPSNNIVIPVNRFSMFESRYIDENRQMETLDRRVENGAPPDVWVPMLSRPPISGTGHRVLENRMNNRRSCDLSNSTGVLLDNDDVRTDVNRNISDKLRSKVNGKKYHKKSSKSELQLHRSSHQYLENQSLVMASNHYKSEGKLMNYSENQNNCALETQTEVSMVTGVEYGGHQESTDTSSTVLKGVLWQQRDKVFSRWKERYFVLTADYLQCFKKSSPSVMHSAASEMGRFIFKLKLTEITSVDLLDKRGYLTICLHLSKEGSSKILLRKPEGIREWHEALKNCITKSRERRGLMKSTKEFWSKKGFDKATSNGLVNSGPHSDHWLISRNRHTKGNYFINRDNTAVVDYGFIDAPSSSAQSSSSNKTNNNKNQDKQDHNSNANFSRTTGVNKNKTTAASSTPSKISHHLATFGSSNSEDQKQIETSGFSTKDSSDSKSHDSGIDSIEKPGRSPAVSYSSGSKEDSNFGNNNLHHHHHLHHSHHERETREPVVQNKYIMQKQRMTSTERLADDFQAGVQMQERTPSLRRVQQQNRRPNSSYIPTSSWNVEDLDFGTVIQRPQITKL